MEIAILLSHDRPAKINFLRRISHELKRLLNINLKEQSFLSSHQQRAGYDEAIDKIIQKLEQENQADRVQAAQQGYPRFFSNVSFHQDYYQCFQELKQIKLDLKKFLQKEIEFDFYEANYHFGSQKIILNEPLSIASETLQRLNIVFHGAKLSQQQNSRDLFFYTLNDDGKQAYEITTATLSAFLQSNFPMEPSKTRIELLACQSQFYGYDLFRRLSDKVKMIVCYSAPIEFTLGEQDQLYTHRVIYKKEIDNNINMFSNNPLIQKAFYKAMKQQTPNKEEEPHWQLFKSMMEMSQSEQNTQQLQ